MFTNKLPLSSGVQNKTGILGSVGDKPKNGDNGLLRILIAEADNVEAFVVHREINKLSCPSSVQRITRIEEFREKIPQFDPQLILVGEAYSTPGFISTIRRGGLTLPIICILKSDDGQAADQLIKAGATDALFFSQITQLALCLESHLTENAKEPFYIKAKPLNAVHFFGQQQKKLRRLNQKISSGTKRMTANCSTLCGRMIAKSRGGLSRVKASSASAWAKLKPGSRENPKLKSEKANAPQPNGNGHNHTPFIRTMANRTATKLQKFWPHEKTASPRFNTSPEADCGGEESPGSEAFRAMELSFKTLFHFSMDGLLLLDNNSNILHANSAACSMFGVQTAELLGKKLLDFVQTPARQRSEKDWDLLLTVGSHEGEFSLWSAEGEPKKIRFRGRTNLWFGVHLLILKDVTQLQIFRDYLESEKDLANPS